MRGNATDETSACLKVKIRALRVVALRSGPISK
jgi:hypothetical protein